MTSEELNILGETCIDLVILHNVNLNCYIYSSTVLRCKLYQCFYSELQLWGKGPLKIRYYSTITSYFVDLYDYKDSREFSSFIF